MRLRKRYVSLFVILIFLISFVIAEIFQDTSSSDFIQGSFFRTFYNSSGFVQLNISQGFTYGDFTSRVFDAGINSTWNNFSWFSELCYGCELPNSSSLETGDFLRPVNMTGNVLLLHMNEGGGNIRDFSVYGNNGTPVQFEGDEYNASGKFGTSLDFENSGGVGPGELINFSSLQQYQFTNQITLEAWIRPESFSGAPTIIDKDPAVFSLYITSFPRTRLDLGATSIVGTTSLSVNTWYHIVATYDGSQVRIYNNGASDATPVSKTGNLATNTKNLVVGSGWNGGMANAFPFDGLIDEVAVYNRSLNAEEVRDHYLRGALRLNLSVRSCDDSACSGESFVELSGNSVQPLSLMGNQYFQYFAKFTTENTAYTSKLYNTSMGYSIVNYAPQVNITYPFNNTNYSVIQTHLNYSALDTDLQACWYTIDLGITNLTMSCGTNITGLSSNEGNNIWRVYANDSAGTERMASSNFFVDSLGPSIEILTPSNASILSNSTVFVNYTFQDLGVGIQSCWWTNSSGARNFTVSCGTNFSFIGQEGTNFVSVYANDTVGNFNSTTHTLLINTKAPYVNILSPIDGSVIGSATNIELNYTAEDFTLQNCWYSVDEIIANTTIPSCVNTTFNLSGQGVFTLRVYANDSFGNIGVDVNTFTLSIDAPSINPVSPVNKYFNLAGSQNVSFTYLPIDLDLQSCMLWTSLDGSFSINSTHLFANSGQQNSFYLNLSSIAEGSYLWATQCNDTIGHYSMTGNQTFYIDKTIPLITINNPSGSFSSLNNIPISLNYSDSSPVQCSYNVTFAATGNVVIGNSELSNCADTTFTVDIESSYFFNLMFNDSAGNFNVSRKTFVVSVPTTPQGEPSGGGGGGGGSSRRSSASSIQPQFRIILNELEPLVIRRGESESIEIEVSNNGARFLNKCKLEVIGGIAEWFSGNDVKALSPGQESNYVISVNVPTNVELGDYFATINVVCDETSSSISYNVKVSGGEFELNILSSERIGTKLRITYILENFADVSKEFTVSYQLIDEKNKIITEGNFEAIDLYSKEKMETKADFELPKNAIGDFNLIMEVSDGIQTQNSEQKVRLTTRGISGFAISDANLKAVSWFGILILFGFGIFMVVKMLRNEIMKRRGLAIPDRQFITIDLNS